MSDDVPDRQRIDFLLFRIVTRISKNPWEEAPLLPVRAHENDATLHSIKKLLVEEGSPLLMKELPATISEQGLRRESSSILLAQKVA